MKTTIKKIFTFKVKKSIIILLGTFVPFFVAHIYAAGCTSDDFFKKNKLPGEKILFYFGYFLTLIFGLFCAGAIFYFTYGFWSKSNYVFFVPLISNLIISIVFLNFLEEQQNKNKF